MAGLEAEIEHLLNGQAVLDPPVDVPIHTEFIPVVKKTIGYIVCAVIINDENKILMIQEAKEGCRGHWYLPAGRMEKNETIVEAVKREVIEESGLKVEPINLLCVEVQKGFWYRFTVAAKVTGGKLKNLSQKNKESLQAAWCSVEDQVVKHEDEILKIRAPDIFKLIDLGLDSRNLSLAFRRQLPVNQRHTMLLLRLMMVHIVNSKVTVAIGNEPLPHLISAMIYEEEVSLEETILRTFHYVFGPKPIDYNLVGVLSLEHYGKPAGRNDGLCISILVSIDSEKERPQMSDPKKYSWHSLVNDSLCDFILGKLSPGMTVPLVISR